MAGSSINIPIILTASVQGAEAGIRAVTNGLKSGRNRGKWGYFAVSTTV